MVAGGAIDLHQSRPAGECTKSASLGFKLLCSRALTLKQESGPVPDKKSCFVIGPIGEESSPARNAADILLRYVIKAGLWRHPSG
jgi:hypothetical protein